MLHRMPEGLHVIITVFLVCLQLTAACDNRVCEPGETSECGCHREGYLGTHVCDNDGSGYGPCTCQPIHGGDADIDADADMEADTDADWDWDEDADIEMECSSDGSSTLPGVRIEFPEQPCVFTLSEAAAGITVVYELVIDETLSGVVSEPQDAGHCFIGGIETGYLALFERLSGGEQSYCVCDIGLCPTPSGEPIEILVGTYSINFSWEGRNWTGPSDYGNPMGTPFPPGYFTFEASSIGTYEGNPFEVVGTFEILLVP